MKQNTKDWIHYSSAIVLILSAVAMAFVSFFLTMDVGAGPLAYIGEALSAALGLFGIGIYAVKKVGEMKTEIREQLEMIRKEAGHEANDNQQ
ncbi:MAG: hypothetical protein IKR91_06165 [Alloprevotella sp.]|jgi:hypothetical protein|nr:hypothetical protein [Alloprevotella sp.]